MNIARFHHLWLVIFLAACQSTTALPQPTAEPSPSATATAAASSTPLPTDTPQTRIIQAENAAQLKPLYTLGKGILSSEPSYSPDGKWLGVPTSSGLYLYDTTNYQSPPRWLTPAYINRFSFSPNNRLLVTDMQLIAVNEGENAPLLEETDGFTPEHYAFIGSFSADSQLVAISNEKNQTGIWKTSDGTLLHTLEGSNPGFSPDGQTLLTQISSFSGEQPPRLQLYNTNTGEQLPYTWEGYKGTLLSNGRILVQDENRTTLYEISTSHALQVFDGLFGALSPDETHLLMFANGALRYYQVENGKALHMLAGKFNDVSITRAHISADGKYIAAGYENLCCEETAGEKFSIWLAADGSLIQDIENSQGSQIGSFSFSPDGQTLLIERPSQGDLQLWKTSDATPITALNGFSAPVQKLAFTPNSQQLVTSVYGNYQNPLTFYETATGNLLRSLPTNASMDGIGIAIHPKGEIIAFGNRFSNIADGQPSNTELMTKMLDSYLYSPIGVAFSPDGTLFAGGSFEARFQVWDMEKQSLLIDQKECREYDSLNSLTFSPDGKMLALACAGQTSDDPASPELPVYEVAENGKRLFNLKAPNPEENTWGYSLVAWTPNGQYIIGAGGNAQVWDAATGQAVNTFQPEKNQKINSLAISPDSSLLALGLESGEVEIWNMLDGKRITTLPASRPYNSVHALGFSPDGTQLAAGYDDGRTLLWGTAP